MFDSNKMFDPKHQQWKLTKNRFNDIDINTKNRDAKNCKNQKFQTQKKNTAISWLVTVVLLYKKLTLDTQVSPKA